MSPRVTLRASLVPPVLALAAAIVFALAFVVDRAATHKVIIHCARDGSWTCSVDEWRAGFRLAPRTVHGEGRITVQPNDDGGGDVRLRDQLVASLARAELRAVYQQLLALDRPTDEALAFEATITAERPFDESWWLATAVNLTMGLSAVVGLWVLRIMLDVAAALVSRRGAWLPDPFATSVRVEGRSDLVLTLVADHSKNF